MKSKLFLHVCCAPCFLGTYLHLKEDYDVTLFYSNSNISTIEEFDKRLNEVKKVAKLYFLDLIIDNYNHKDWFNFIKEYKDLPEKSKRCDLCVNFRLNQTAKKAKELGFKLFASTLSLGNRKNANIINKIGESISKKYTLEFLKGDWKKNNGWNHSIYESRRLNIYRQNFCGCEYSS